MIANLILSYSIWNHILKILIISPQGTQDQHEEIHTTID